MSSSDVCDAASDGFRQMVSAGMSGSLSVVAGARIIRAGAGTVGPPRGQLWRRGLQMGMHSCGGDCGGGYDCDWEGRGEGG